jgi:alpha-amylase/alpha-mannosidase (GH57 family)
MHGHFYQPPREDPWTGEVPEEPSAAPFPNWNSRITAECYRPTGAAPIVGDYGQVVDVVDNYRLLSYNVGPTLLGWLETEAADVYDRMVQADRAGGDGGHAIAQAYGHAILPLCNDRDLRTQVRWGLADFRHRFGREPAGMWLPETAVDRRVLGVLAEEGVGFTILARYQVDLVAPDGPGRRPTVYRWQHHSAPERGIDLVTYDPAISHDVAFGGLGGRDLVDRAVLEGASAADAGDDQSLVVVACDGETFGHHQRFAELGLAYGLAVEAPRRGVEVPCLADWLKSHPPDQQAEVHTSAWSCAHGVGRWLEDCGCHTGGEEGWNQQWRAPLRAALDILRDHAAVVFERRGGAYLSSPWQARDAYIDVLTGEKEVDEFLAQHLTAPTGDGAGGQCSPETRQTVLTLLECQRNALLMYTSCGWFFNDLAGIETLQVLRYAARCCDLLNQLGEPPPYDRFLGTLAGAVSNRPTEGSGAEIWARHIEPLRGR